MASLMQEAVFAILRTFDLEARLVNLDKAYMVE
jgi:hypothetical protein